jgi:UDP-GlcNAc:undecaprenyl-phosphate GlcNAc-1-phosphate transferase
MKALIRLDKRYSLFGKRDKIEGGRISRLGGLGIIFAFAVALLLSGSLVFDPIKGGIFLCSFLIAIFGLWDDIYKLSWKKQLVFQFALALVMILAGLTVDYIANPLGGREFRLDPFVWGNISILGSLFVILWIVGFINVVNWLDGMDALAGGVGTVAALTIFLLAISALVNQPPLGVMAIALVGALLGFLIFNKHPARIYMGTSGAYFLGFLPAVLAIFAGGKIATVFLVMGFPILDAAWVVAERVRAGKSPFVGGDRLHLQYVLSDRGWPEEKVVLFICALSALFGLCALIFQGVYKFLVLVILYGAVSVWMVKVKRRENEPSKVLTE